MMQHLANLSVVCLTSTAVLSASAGSVRSYFNDQLTVAFQEVDADNFEATLTFNGGDHWFAMAVNKDGKAMTGNDYAFVCAQNTQGAWELHRVKADNKGIKSSSYESASVVPASVGKCVKNSDGNIIMTAKRSYKASGDDQDKVDVRKGGATAFNFAYGKSTSFGFHKGAKVDKFDVNVPANFLAAGSARSYFGDQLHVEFSELDADNFEATLTFTGGDKWFAFAVNKDGKAMTGNDHAFVCAQNTESAWELHRVKADNKGIKSSSYASASAVPTSDGQCIKNSDGHIVMKVKRSYKASGDDKDKVDVLKGSSTAFNFAYGKSTSFGFHKGAKVDKFDIHDAGALYIETSDLSPKNTTY